MAEQLVIVSELKAALKERGHTYRDVAAKLRLSVASVKRLFSGGNLSLRRVDQICELLELELSELLRRARHRPGSLRQLTAAQEQEIVSDVKLLFVTWKVLNRTSFEDIVRDHRLTEREVLKCFVKLDRLKVIELQPGNRTRLLISRQLSWRLGGPVQKFLHQTLLREFLDSQFTGPQEHFFFNGGEVSEDSVQALRVIMQSASRQCAEIIEHDRTPSRHKRGATYVMALRGWRYSGFKQFDR
ncbi:MAG TPA: helix-turn-helix transcriptional regulator [Steroidobacteraceae bacterium]|jgi:DNA-binding Xre family transcriptional regulator